MREATHTLTRYHASCGAKDKQIEEMKEAKGDLGKVDFLQGGGVEMEEGWCDECPILGPAYKDLSHNELELFHYRCALRKVAVYLRKLLGWCGCGGCGGCGVVFVVVV